MVKGNYEIIKSINSSLVLDALRMKGELSRSDLSRITGLTSGTITNISNRLIEIGLIEESGESKIGTGGRRPTLLRLNDNGAFAIVVDIRTSSIEIRLVDLYAKTIDTIEKNDTYSVEKGIEEIINGINYFEETYNISEKLLGIGISVPGWIDYKTGKIIRLPNLVGWDNAPVKQELEDLFNLPVFIENDANLAALGELWFGKVKSYKHMIYVLIEDGIGSGLILNQQIYRGNGISVGELGHLPIASEKRLCSCGNYGCLDTISSAKAMVERYAELKNHKIEYLDLVKLSNENDLAANQIISEAAENLGKGISILINLFHPEAIIFGGKVVETIPYFLSLVKKEINNSSLTPMLQDMVISSSDLMTNSSILGAVALVFQSTLQPYSINSLQR